MTGMRTAHAIGTQGRDASRLFRECPYQRDRWRQTLTPAFRKRLFWFALLLCRNREDAEEVVQETLMKVFEHRSQIRKPERVFSWTFKIAKKRLLDETAPQ
jgi:DNA-directed RNA polymerase specialized sigma24 family protein